MSATKTCARPECSREFLRMGRRVYCSAECRREARNEQSADWYASNVGEIRARRRSAMLPGEWFDYEDNTPANDGIVRDGRHGGPGVKQYEREQRARALQEELELQPPVPPVALFPPPAEQADGTSYRGRRSDRRGRLPDPVTAPQAYGIMRRSAQPPPATAAPQWDRFGPNVAPPVQLTSGHNISPVPRREAQDAAEADYARRSAEHLRSRLDFARRNGT
jgi:hypothetical protein